MKKQTRFLTNALILFLLSLIMILLFSCSKEYSYEKQCGTIVDKDYNQLQVLVKYDNITIAANATYLELRAYKIGDPYCK